MFDKNETGRDGNEFGSNSDKEPSWWCYGNAPIEWPCSCIDLSQIPESLSPDDSKSVLFKKQMAFQCHYIISKKWTSKEAIIEWINEYGPVARRIFDTITSRLSFDEFFKQMDEKHKK